MLRQRSGQGRGLDTKNALWMISGGKTKQRNVFQEFPEMLTEKGGQMSGPWVYTDISLIIEHVIRKLKLSIK